MQSALAVASWAKLSLWCCSGKSTGPTRKAAQLLAAEKGVGLSHAILPPNDACSALLSVVASGCPAPPCWVFRSRGHPSKLLVLRPLVRCAKPRNNSKSTNLRTLPKPQEKATPMTGILQNYLPLVVFIAVAGVIGLALLIAPFLVAFQQPDPEKLSAYECGFNAFDDARMKFDVRFYLVAILFIIFDLEVAFLFPWAVAFGKLGATGFWSMVVFLAVLTIGFAYEWKKGALEWD
jgi:NADH-quinone oxidoreductase subunit A